MWLTLGPPGACSGWAGRRCGGASSGCACLSEPACPQKRWQGASTRAPVFVQVKQTLTLESENLPLALMCSILHECCKKASILILTQRLLISAVRSDQSSNSAQIFKRTRSLTSPVLVSTVQHRTGSSAALLPASGGNTKGPGMLAWSSCSGCW